MKISALHAGQLPALIVFTQAVFAKGSFWTTSLMPRHAAGNELRLEYTGSLIPQERTPLVLLAMSDLEERRRRLVDATAEDHMRGGIAAWHAMTVRRRACPGSMTISQNTLQPLKTALKSTSWMKSKPSSRRTTWLAMSITGARFRFA